jgi:hypothetical protein
MLYGNQPLQGGVVYNQNPGWLATLLSGIKNVGSAVGQGALDVAPYLLNNAGNSNSLPTSAVQNNPYNASDTPTPSNPNNFKIQNANPSSSSLQQAMLITDGQFSQASTGICFSKQPPCSTWFKGPVGVQMLRGGLSLNGFALQNTNGNPTKSTHR